MSAVKIDTKNINIPAMDVAAFLLKSKRYEGYGENVVKKIAFEIVERYKDSIVSKKAASGIIFDDEELFDEIYDYMHKKLKEVFSSSDIAYIVNDVFMQIEDLLFDEGLIAYHT